MPASRLSDSLTLAQASADKALADIAALMREGEQARASVSAAISEAARLTAGLGHLDEAALSAFLQRPYAVRPLGQGRYELLVPSFIGFRAGWPVRREGEYMVYEVSRFSHLLAPVPDWLAGELGFTAPSWRGVLAGAALEVTEGDPDAVADKLGGSRVIARREGRRLILKPASRFEILRRIIRDEGFLPYAPKPLPADLLRKPLIAADESGQPIFSLRAHQAAAWETFKGSSAVSIVAPPQTGKSYPALYALAALRGRKLILAPTRVLCEQWRLRLEAYLTPEAAREVTISTYMGAAKHLKGEYALVIFDEGHHAPADVAMDAAATVQAQARLLLSATPYREDGNDDLIIALGGWPVGADWPLSDVQRPSVHVWIEAGGQAAKMDRLEALCAEPAAGKTIVFVWRLNIGQRAAGRLGGVPFIHAKTKRPLDVLTANDLVVMTRVGNEGLSVPAARVVEIDFLFGSRTEAGQRAGRLMYDFGQDQPGQHHIVMTPSEYASYGKRLLAYERLGLDIVLHDQAGAVRGVRPALPAAQKPASAKNTPRRDSQRAASERASTGAAKEAGDAISAVLGLPPLRARLQLAGKSLGSNDRARTLMPVVMRLVWDRRLSVNDMLLAKGQAGQSTFFRYKAAAEALASFGLLAAAEGGAFAVNQAEINRLKGLAG